MNVRLKPLCVALGMAGLLSGVSGAATASGFQLLEQNASQLGNAYAGTAAAAEDASTIYFNPAGMSFLSSGRELTVSLNAIKPTAKFSNGGSVYTSGSGAPFPLGFTPPGFPPLVGNGGDAGDWAFLPAIYYAHAVDSQWSIGIGINAPFGLKTDYESPWAGAFQGVLSKLETLAITPTVSIKVNPDFAVGFGIRAQKAKATLTSIGFSRTGTELTGDDWGYGGSLGFLWQVTPATRIGASYQTQITYQLQGNVQGGDIFASTGGRSAILPVTADLTLPDIATVSVAHELNSKWDLLGDIAWTNWQDFQQLAVVGPTGSVVAYTPENWQNTWRFAAGTNYKYTDKMKFRFGVAYDQTPVQDQFRTVRIPDGDRWWLAIGLQYQVTPNGKVDVGYSHIFINNPSINKTEANPVAGLGTRVTGNYDSSVDIIGVQYSQSF
jgi:long-chain fatty acid transport protein